MKTDLPEKGKILISKPFLQDAHFQRSIIYLAEYNSDGSIGFTLNQKKIQYTDILVPHLGLPKLPIFMGGPVGLDTLHFVHSLGKDIPDSIHIKHEIYWGGNFEVLQALVSSNNLLAKKIRLFRGYSGWAPEQLADEIAEDAWWVSDINTDLLFNASLSGKEFWQEILKTKGGEYALWANAPEDPSFN